VSSQNRNLNEYHDRRIDHDRRVGEMTGEYRYLMRIIFCLLTYISTEFGVFNRNTVRMISLVFDEIVVV
jgi:hypothetical protein